MLYWKIPFIHQGIKSGGGDTGLLNGNGGGYINLGADSGKLPDSMTVTSPVKVPEINADIVVSFGIKNDLLEAAGTNAVEGLVCKGPLGGLCGHGSLSGMNDVLKTMNSGKLNSWLNVTRFDIVELSWKVLASTDLEVKFQTKLTINFPGAFSTMVESMLKWSLNISLPNITCLAKRHRLQRLQHVYTGELCPVVKFWFYIINQQLAILQNLASLGVSGNSNLLDAAKPMQYERTYYLNLKNKSFPASFINWLVKNAQVCVCVSIVMFCYCGSATQFEVSSLFLNKRRPAGLRKTSKARQLYKEEEKAASGVSLDVAFKVSKDQP
ncbi:BPI fold-containing family A, member 6 [Apodemus speciosus]|uniref:BPI fold-containing family A, member 6 n=1 Tax=Apodemus speciosus TaxID=105296 RepID=A0ABQ0EJ88_APOSI